MDEYSVPQEVATDALAKTGDYRFTEYRYMKFVPVFRENFGARKQRILIKD